MSAPAASLGPDNISKDHLTRLLLLYPAVLSSFYKTKVKDAKKLPSALEDDKWRYELLPTELKSRCGKGSSSSKAELKKEELQRLVQWKITHGTFRPFLPGLIRKNDPHTVKTITQATFAAQAAEAYDDIPAPKLPAKLAEAITEVSKLQGVGPATAPLICSVFDPQNVPFFEDELYQWLFPQSQKLKYVLKEYQDLFHATRKLQKKLNVGAVELEKAGFVIGHFELLDDSQKASLMSIGEHPGASLSESTEQPADEETKGEPDPKKPRKTSQSQNPPPKSAQKRLLAADEELGNKTAARRSKRTRL